MQHIQKRRFKASAAAAQKTTGQHPPSQWWTPAGFSLGLVVLTVFLYFVGLVFRETFFSAFDVDAALVPLEKQDYIYLGGKAAFYALTRFAERLGNDGRLVGCVFAFGASAALLALVGDFAREKVQCHSRASRWVTQKIFRNLFFVVAAGLSLWLIALALAIGPAIALAIPAVLGERVGRHVADDARAKATETLNCTRKAKDAPCVEVVNDEEDEVIITGVLLGGNKDHAVILNEGGAHVVSLGNRTVRPLFHDGLPIAEPK
ncbi:hypothetical protein ACI2UO_11705 [Ralstonia nicotianae]